MAPRWLDFLFSHPVSYLIYTSLTSRHCLTRPALSIFWIFLSIPTLIAQPIALAIKGQGGDGYLGVQLLAGSAYIVAFIFREFPPPPVFSRNSMITGL